MLRRGTFGIGYGPAEPVGQTATKMVGFEVVRLDALTPEDISIVVCNQYTWHF
jgi:hypothetical protein